jgi:hypothetical protein
LGLPTCASVGGVVDGGGPATAVVIATVKTKKARRAVAGINRPAPSIA